MKKYLSLIIIPLIVNILTGATTGKISGKVTDISTGEPLVGTNVVIEGSHLGAATDMDGYYVILNVPPGLHSLKSFMIGYSNVNIVDALVVMDQTTTIDIVMTSEVLSMAEVTVVAERPVVVQEISNSQLNVTAETIETMPITDVTEVIGLQAGVEGLSVRGGSSSETSFIVDGFLMNDERSNIPFSAVSLSTVREVSIQTGGFNAEYGNARSGVINIVTDEGSPDKYGGSFLINYRPPGPKHLGISPYDPDSYFLRPYLDPAVCWTGTSAGEPYEDLNKNGQWDESEPYSDFNNDGELTSWDSYTRRQFPSFEGWNAYSQRTLEDNNPDNDLSPEAAKKLFEWQHRRQGDITKPDYTVDFNFGGPVPLISKSLGNLRFNMSFRDIREMFMYPLSSDSYSENVARMKITSDINSETKLSLIGLYSEIHSSIQYNWRPTPTGTMIRSQYSLANMISGEALFVPAYYSPSTIYRSMFGLQYTRVISSESFYEFRLQHMRNRYFSYQMPDRDTTAITPIPGYPDFVVDESPYGYSGVEGTNAIGDNIRIGGWMNLGRERSNNNTTYARFDYTNQANSSNQIRAGLELTINDYNIRSFTTNPGMSTWNRAQVYEIAPYRIGAYIHDKMEFKGLIANLSLRADLTDPNTDYYLLDPFDSYYKSGQGDKIEEDAPKEKAKKHLIFSPRIGISHPISDVSKLYFNYGHYRSEASSTTRFRLQREYNGQVTDIGNPNLLQEKTVSYELGYSHNLFNRFLLNLAAYYKNIDNQVGLVSYQNINSSVNYSRPENNNYEDIRGLEITIDKQRGKWITGFVNYTYMINTSGYFGIREFYENPTQQREYTNSNTYQSRPVPRPYARASIDFHTPEKFGLKIGSSYPLAGFTLNILASWKTGSYATYNPMSQAGIINNVQWRDTYNVNLRITKDFKINNVDMMWYLDVNNLLNTKFLSYSGFANSQDYNDYMGSLHFDFEEGIEHGNDRIGVYREDDVAYVPMRETNINPLDLQDFGIESHYDGSGAVYMYEGAPIVDVITDGEGNVLEYVYDNSTAVKEYIRYDEENGEWYKISNSSFQKLLDDKAYIDMPNIKSMTFLNPREIKFGIQVSF